MKISSPDEVLRPAGRDDARQTELTVEKSFVGMAGAVAKFHLAAATAFLRLCSCGIYGLAAVVFPFSNGGNTKHA